MDKLPPHIAAKLPPTIDELSKDRLPPHEYKPGDLVLVRHGHERSSRTGYCNHPCQLKREETGRSEKVLPKSALAGDGEAPTLSSD